MALLEFFESLRNPTTVGQSHIYDGWTSLVSTVRTGGAVTVTPVTGLVGVFAALGVSAMTGGINDSLTAVPTLILLVFAVANCGDGVMPGTCIISCLFSFLAALAT
jgi:hypothetical protein